MGRQWMGNALAALAPPPRRRGLVRVLALVGLVFAVYLNALDNPFVYDDYSTVQTNPSLVDPSNVVWLLQYTAFRPVVNVSYAVDRWLFGTSVVGHHLTSVLLHACNAILVFALVRRALTDSRIARGVRTTPALLAQERFAAFSAAALFAVHPVMTEAVGYVSGRSELLCAAFLIAALLLARSALPPAGPHRMRPTPARWVRAIGASACAILALLSKEVAAALPVLFVGYEFLLVPAEAEVRRRRVLVIFVPGVILIGIALAYRIRSLAGIDALWSSEPPLDLLTQTIVIWRYLGLLVWPVGQALMHDVHRVTSLLDPLALVAAAGLVALVGTSWTLRHRLPTLAFGLLWFLATIAPSSSLVRLQEGMAEHRVYIASIGVFLIAGMTLGRMSLRWALVSGHVRLRWAAAVALAVVVLGGLTIRRNVVWASPILLWQEATAAAPTQWQPRYALGDALRETGRCEEAVGAYEEALALQLPNPKVRLNLGICLAELGRLDEAEATFKRVIAVMPELARAYNNLAGVEILRRRIDEARRLYAKAIEVEPENTHARLQLARLAEEAGDRDGARRFCEEALHINPFLKLASECLARLDNRGPDPGLGQR